MLPWLVALAGALAWVNLALAASGAASAPTGASRAALEARFDAEEAACQGRFAVNACVEAVRQRRREALEPIRERELQARTREREARAAQRRAGIAQRQAQAASAAAVALPRAREDADGASGSARAAQLPASGPPLRESIRGAKRELMRQIEQDQRAEQAARRSAAAERRREQTQHTQVRIREREAMRAGRPPDPLPPPAHASGPSR